MTLKTGKALDLIAYHMQKVCQLLSIPRESVYVVTDKVCPRLYKGIRQDAIDSGMIGAYWFDDMTGRHMVYCDTTTGRIAETVAHELRHVWQALTDTLGAYDHDNPTDNAHEQDARAWAAQYCAMV